MKSPPCVCWAVMLLECPRCQRWRCVLPPSGSVSLRIDCVCVLGWIPLLPAQIVQAAHCGLPILGLALISNRCKGPKDTVPNPTHQEVLDSVNAASKDIKTLVAAVIAELDVSGFPAPMASELFALHGAAAAAKVAAAAAATAPSGCPVSGKGAAAPVCDSPCAAPSPICASTIAGAIAGALAATILFTLAKRK
jgi:hypothetical protein